MSKTDDISRAADPYDPDQQPIQRVVGRRVSRPAGGFPDAATRAAMDANLNYLTRVPKGILSYRNHDEMSRDRERWTLETMLARQGARG